MCDADLSEVWFTLTGRLEPCSSDDDGDGDGVEPGYERSLAQRDADCKLVRSILATGLVSANVRDSLGASLLYHALLYDHRHPAQMIRVCVEAGADVNLDTHLLGGQKPLDTEWLEEDGPHRQVNREKRHYLIMHGAVPGAEALAAAAQAATDAAAKSAAAVAAATALDQRLEDARRTWQAERLVPSWDDDANIDAGA